MNAILTKIFCTSLFAICAFFFSILFLARCLEVQQTKSWVLQQATILDSSVQVSHSGKNISYCPIIHVGIDYLGTKIPAKLETQEGCGQSAILTPKQFPKGYQIAVRFNPQNPNEARVAWFSMRAFDYFYLIFDLFLIWSTIYFIKMPAEKFKRKNQS